MDEYGRFHFPSTTNNDIWMNTNELIDLFGIPYPTLMTNIKAIYKSGILNGWEVQKCIKLSNGNSIDVYSLPLIISLSFRLDTLGAYKMRECVINKLTIKPKTGIVFMNVCTHEYVNECKYGHNQMLINENVMKHSDVPMYEIPIIRSSLNGYKGMCDHLMKPASSSGKPFSEQSSSHSSRVLIRKNLHISSPHR